VAVIVTTGLALLVVIPIGLSRRIEALNFVEPIATLTAGRREFVILAFAGTLLLLTPTSLLPRRNERRLIQLLAVVAVFYFSILPFLQPAIAQHRLEEIATVLDDDNVCLQNFPYTCGPAAAVTALRLLNIDAQEGELAIAAHTSPIVGTAPDSLALAIEEQFAGQGIQAKYRWFESLDDIVPNTYTLAIIRQGALIDHYVAVVYVGRDEVLFADPINGYRALPRASFEAIWRGSGIVITRDRRPINVWKKAWALPE
jgi:predicted double-glycine peptidase